jgi:thiamine biosynthesis lipoprotein
MLREESMAKASEAPAVRTSAAPNNRFGIKARVALSILGSFIVVCSHAVAISAPLHSAQNGSMVENAPQRFTFTEYHMGIDARIVVYATRKEDADKAVEAAYKKIAALEQIMSDYRAESELMRLCRQAGSGPVKVSPELYEVLNFAKVLSIRTNGAFDVTVGPMVQIWRKARKEKILPTPEEIRKAQAAVGYRNMILNALDRTVELKVPGMRLDLGGIAKGHAADAALRTIQSFGIPSVLIEMGGDLRLGEAPPGTDGWKVTVANAAGPGRSAEMVLKNCSLATSGDTEQFVEIGGKRYSHVVDPKTGYGLSSRVQASVIGRNGFTTDPISTAMTVLDEPGRERLLRFYPSIKAYVKVAP